MALKVRMSALFLLLVAAPHTPCWAEQNRNLVILVDDHDHETPRTKEVQALTLELAAALRDGSASILVSCSLLFNLVTRLLSGPTSQHPENSALNEVSLANDTWSLYLVLDASYALLIPSSQANINKAHLHFKLATGSSISSQELKFGIQFRRLVNKSHLLPDPSSKPQALGQFLETRLVANRYKPAFEKIEFQFFFITKDALKRSLGSNGSWVIYFSGHGATSNFSVGLQLERLTETISFFDAYLPVKLLFLTSCHLGGTPKAQLLAALPGLTIPITFGSIGQYTVPAVSSLDFTTFFQNAHKAGDTDDEDSALVDALRAVSSLSPDGYSLHRTADVPTCVHGTKQQLFDLHGTLEHSPPKDSFLGQCGESDSLTLRDRSALLFRRAGTEQRCVKSLPTHVSVLNSTTSSFRELKKEAWRQFPCASDLINAFDFTRPVGSAHLRYPYRGLLAAIKAPREFRSEDELRLCCEFLQAHAHEDYIFPAFISTMQPTAGPFAAASSSHAPSDEPAIHHLRAVVVKPGFNKLVGVLQFLRDTFLDCRGMNGSRCFLIDQLTGPNDFPLTFDLMLLTRLSAANNDLAKNRKLFELQSIQLSQVLIQTSNNSVKDDALEVVIRFTFDGKAWNYYFKGDPSKIDILNVWNFKQYPLAQSNDLYATGKKLAASAASEEAVDQLCAAMSNATV